jgi:hypothetical protein
MSVKNDVFKDHGGELLISPNQQYWVQPIFTQDLCGTRENFGLPFFSIQEGEGRNFIDIFNRNGNIDFNNTLLRSFDFGALIEEFGKEHGERRNAFDFLVKIVLFIRTMEKNH